MPSWKKVITSGSSAVLSGLTLSGLSNQGSELTSIMINGSGVVGTRELSSTAFSTMDNYSSFTAAGDAGDNQTISSGNTLTLTGTNGITTTGAAGDSVDIALNATQTGITSILNTSLVTGRDSDNQIKYSTDDNIIFRVAGGDGVTFKASGEIEATSLDISGDVDVDGTLETDALTIGGVTSVPFESADHSKLDGIEASATADQSNAEIVAAVEAGTDSNTFTDADHSKLNAIEASADVTDATNVTAAGALMDSELSGISHVKALNQSVVSGATPTFTTTNFTDATNKRLMTDAQETLLDTVETNADVTDTANVTSAGAVMDSEVTNLAFVKALAKGISDGNVLTANDVVADNDFLRIDGTEVEGLTVAETLSALSVESGADVTDTTNVTAAGALMDSECASLASVKAINQGLTATSDVNFNTININATTTSTTKTSGALIVDGGVGVAENIHAGGDVVAYASSDERLKDNLQVIQDPLDKVGQISGYEFDWNEESPEWAQERGHDIGVVAQEIQKVHPEIVIERTNGYLGVDYKRIIPLLIESIKELKQEVEDLKKKVN